MASQQSVLDELEEAVHSGSRERRVDTLRRITDLFLLAPTQLDNEQIGVFDDVLAHLTARVEAGARAELANRLAPIAQAPAGIVKRLAHDDEIMIAGPVLQQSTRLATEDLVSIAQEKGQAHLHAIAGRKSIDEQVTDVLVKRGDREVALTLAANAGAAFSDVGYSTMVKRAESDADLVEKLGRRIDIPLPHFRELLLRATEAVRARLLAGAPPETQDEIRKILADTSRDIEQHAPAPRNFEDARRLVSLLKETGRLDETEIHAFTRHEKYEEAIAGLAALCAVPPELIERLAKSGRTDALLVPCKAAGFGWGTVRALLDLRSRHNAVAAQDMDVAMKEFAKLSQPTAARVLRFWQVRQTATVQPAGERHAAK
ncbi:MAG: DUF2336 domain-containing protein [Alphaproteobacteria bacterium]|nr:MAG: DUF2336 domain-containing protein [Alphaproteobacteria bacterium]